MATSQRLHWVDLAKAVAIILVVVYHVGGVGMDRLVGSPEGQGSPFWTGVNEIFTPVRMPLFFICAGLLARAALTRPWRDLRHPRYAILLWPYLLWSLVFAGIAGFAYSPDNPTRYVIDQLVRLPLGASPYWFLTALVVFFTAGKLLTRWPTAVLALSGVVAVLTPILATQILATVPHPVDQTLLRFGRNAFWWFLGCFGGALVGRVAALSPPLLVLGGGTAYLGLTALARLGDLGAELGFVLSATGVAAAVGLSVWAVRHERVRGWSRHLASRTLPIYLLHPMLIMLTVLVAVRLFGVQLGVGMATALTPVLTVLFTAAAVWVYDRTQQTRASWVFTAPARGPQSAHVP